MKQQNKISRLKSFVWPAQDAPFILRIAPYIVLVVAGLALLTGTAAGWTYTNSVKFCGTSCHTMPPEYNTYLRSPHARVGCVECHLGRDTLNVVLPRKIAHSETLYAMTFKTYEYPIVAEKMRPAVEACETCHFPTKFSTDSMKEIRTHADDEINTPLSIFLLLRTGGGAKRQGLGRGIHWHIENEVYFLATDRMEQDIPYVRVINDDGSVEEFIDVNAEISPASIMPEQLTKVDCITCHNRVTHSIPAPAQSVDTALYSGDLAEDLPFVRREAVRLLSQDYESTEAANLAFETLAAFYSENYPQVFSDQQEEIKDAVRFLKSTYIQSAFPEQELFWNTHPVNVGHKESPGCFRCHDGEHLNSNNEAIRLECNLCHSIPVVSDPGNFVSSVSIVRGAEPASHTEALWISRHGKEINETCVRCHVPKDPAMDYTQLNGQKPPNDGSFCGNSACHQTIWRFAGFESGELNNAP